MHDRARVIRVPVINRRNHGELVSHLPLQLAARRDLVAIVDILAVKTVFTEAVPVYLVERSTRR